ncbi:MAG: RidA family protein [Deltaproteobacteria bacterium]|nr:RidA family protein [Deltaproteobacteria bacterium]
MGITIQTDRAPKPVGPYSQAVRAGDLLFVSGQLGIDPATGHMVEGGGGDQARQVMANLKAVLEAGGSGFSSVVKTTIFLADMADFSEVNQVYGEFFPSEPPARSTFQVAGLPLGARVEIEMIATCGRL